MYYTWKKAVTHKNYYEFLIIHGLCKHIVAVISISRDEDFTCFAKTIVDQQASLEAIQFTIESLVRCLKNGDEK